MDWISVKDRLPCEEGQYLVYLEVKGRPSIKVSRFNRGVNHKRPHFYSNNSYSVKDITHWMHLPSIPILRN